MSSASRRDRWRDDACVRVHKCTSAVMFSWHMTTSTSVYVCTSPRRGYDTYVCKLRCNPSPTSNLRASSISAVLSVSALPRPPASAFASGLARSPTERYIADALSHASLLCLHTSSAPSASPSSPSPCPTCVGRRCLLLLLLRQQRLHRRVRRRLPRRHDRSHMRAASTSAAALASSSAYSRAAWAFSSIAALLDSSPWSPKSLAAFAKLFEAVGQLFVCQCAEVHLP